jgi:hypothetical protein
MGGVTSSVASKMAFFPPSPPSYGVVDEDEEPPPPPPPAEDDAYVVSTRRVAITGVRRSWSAGVVEARRVRTRRGSEIITMYVRHPRVSLTVLFSHGNAGRRPRQYVRDLRPAQRTPPRQPHGVSIVLEPLFLHHVLVKSTMGDIGTDITLKI